MKKNLIYIFLSFIAISAMTSCRKDSFEGTATGSNGTTFVRFINSSAAAPVNSLFFAPFTDIQKIKVFDIRRDVSSKAALNSSVTVTLESDQAFIDAYNTEHGTTYEFLPESYYTLNAPGYTKTANGLSLKFDAGDFSRNYNIMLDGSKLDLSKKYAVAYKITTVSGDAKLTNVKEEKTIMVTIGIKNKYDGVYLLTGYHNRAPYNFPYETEVELRTLNGNTVVVYWPDAGSNGHPIGVGPDNDLSWYGATMAPAFTFDLSTNDVINAYNTGGATVVSLYTTSDGSEVLANKYNPSTKTISVSWKYSGNPARGFFDTYKYLRARN